MSELWTNTSLSPNLVIHSPLLVSLLPNFAEQVFPFLLVHLCHHLSGSGWQSKSMAEMEIRLDSCSVGGLSWMRRESLVESHILQTVANPSGTVFASLSAASRIHFFHSTLLSYILRRLYGVCSSEPALTTKNYDTAITGSTPARLFWSFFYQVLVPKRGIF